MMFMQKLFLLLLPTVALAENVTAEEPRVAPAEDVTTVESRVALAENETTEESVSEDIDFDTGVFGNETNTTMSYEEVEAKTFCRDTIGQCHNEGGVCMTSHSIKSWGSGGHCSSTKTFSFGNCPVCHCCIAIKPPPHPEVCRTTSECKHKGGYCCGRQHCTSGHFAKMYCHGGYDCGCCINRPEPEKCRTTSECKHKGGYCCGRQHCTSGHFAKKYCHGGHDCGCCINRPVPEKCRTTSECKHKGGYCCGREHCTNGHFVKRYCHGGRDCGCCLKESCQEKQSCTRAKGRCKSSCQSHESEHHGGCSGSGCKCCCPKSHPSPYGREVTTDKEAN
ncbi:latent-transforming growth factor beta-binding protein 4-like isoform X1 [Macrobrachium rosenbergii]|uniref:latent-transforming growth factor beta-binding protein 4-like isoform X1 n=1 Tax=Macrobrachium rosenbergii TaxID=79674 RepID=UPI0034D3A970